MSAREKAKKVAPAKKSRAGEKKSRRQKKVAPERKSRAKGKKVFAINTKEYIPNMMLYVRVYGTHRAPYYSLQALFLGCLEASSLRLLSGVALLSVHEGPFSSTNGPVVNFIKR